MPNSEADRVKAYKRRWKALLQKRERMLPIWRELRDYVNPERFEFEDETLDGRVTSTTTCCRSEYQGPPPRSLLTAPGFTSGQNVPVLSSAMVAAS